MKNARRQMDGLALNYYTVTNDWAKKGKALEFSDEEYLRTLSRAYAIEELISRHSGIMDRYDPEKRVALVVDEWGV